MKPSLERPLGTAFNAAGQPGQPGRCVSVVALCHLQRVQGGDQFYRQPPPAFRCRSVQFDVALPVSVARTY